MIADRNAKILKITELHEKNCGYDNNRSPNDVWTVMELKNFTFHNYNQQPKYIKIIILKNIRS